MTGLSSIFSTANFTRGSSMGSWCVAGGFIPVVAFNLSVSGCRHHLKGMRKRAGMSCCCCCVGHNSSPAWSWLQQFPLLAAYIHCVPKWFRCPALIIAGISFILGCNLIAKVHLPCCAKKRQWPQATIPGSLDSHKKTHYVLLQFIKHCCSQPSQAASILTRKRTMCCYNLSSLVSLSIVVTMYQAW
jgi:hypothetical protein